MPQELREESIKSKWPRFQVQYSLGDILLLIFLCHVVKPVMLVLPVLLFCEKFDCVCYDTIITIVVSEIKARHFEEV